MSLVQIVRTDDWEVIYLDGQLWKEAHSFYFSHTLIELINDGYKGLSSVETYYLETTEEDNWLAENGSPSMFNEFPEGLLTKNDLVWTLKL